MKLSTLLLSGVLCFSFFACDNIAPKDRLIPHENGQQPEKPAGRHVVLLEDYTGQKCNNCPKFAEGIEQSILSVYGHQVVPVSVHCGILALKKSKLTTEEGMYYAQTFGVSSVPAGVVDRTPISGNTLPSLDIQAVTKMIASLVGKPRQLDMFGRALYSNPEKTSINLSFLAQANKSTPAFVKEKGGILNVWLIEDGVKGYQEIKGKPADKNYNHRHLLRAALAGRDGTPYRLGETLDLEYTLPERLSSESTLSLVAFIADPETAQIIETIEIDIK